MHTVCKPSDLSSSNFIPSQADGCVQCARPMQYLCTPKRSTYLAGPPRQERQEERLCLQTDTQAWRLPLPPSPPSWANKEHIALALGCREMVGPLVPIICCLFVCLKCCFHLLPSLGKGSTLHARLKQLALFFTRRREFVCCKRWVGFHFSPVLTLLQWVRNPQVKMPVLFITDNSV